MQRGGPLARQSCTRTRGTSYGSMHGVADSAMVGTTERSRGGREPPGLGPCLRIDALLLHRPVLALGLGIAQGCPALGAPARGAGHPPVHPQLDARGRGAVPGIEVGAELVEELDHLGPAVDGPEEGEVPTPVDKVGVGAGAQQGPSALEAAPVSRRHQGGVPFLAAVGPPKDKVDVGALQTGGRARTSATTLERRPDLACLLDLLVDLADVVAHDGIVQLLPRGRQKSQPKGTDSPRDTTTPLPPWLGTP